MKLFGRSGGYWLFWWGAVYLIAGMLDIFWLKMDLSPFLQIAWIMVISMPLCIPRLARWLNMRTFWE